MCVCVGEIISLSWFSKELKKDFYQRTIVFMVSSLYFSFANQYLLGGGLRFQQCWCLGTSYLCVTLLSNLIYLASRELVSLRVGCVTMWSRGSHQVIFVSHSYQTWFTWFSGNWCLCMWIVWPRAHEVHITGVDGINLPHSLRLLCFDLVIFTMLDDSLEIA